MDLKVDEASLYFGELSNDYVFVKTSTNEFHYPKGDDNVTAVVRRGEAASASEVSSASCCSASASDR